MRAFAAIVAVLIVLGVPGSALASRSATARERRVILRLDGLPACSHRYMAVRIDTVQGGRIAVVGQRKRPPTSCYQGDGYSMFKRARRGAPWRYWFASSEPPPCGGKFEAAIIDLLGECNEPE